MSLERYLAVFNADFYFRHLSKKRLAIVLISLWTIIISAAIIFSVNRIGSSKTVVLGYCLLFVMAAIWNMFAYIRIFWYLKAKHKSTLALERRLHGKELSNVQARRSYKCLAILMAFLVSYMPYLILVFVVRSKKAVIDANILHVTFTLLCLNSSINPYVYLISSPSLRSKMIDTILRLKTRLQYGGYKHHRR